MGVSQGIIGVYRDHSKRIIKKYIMAETVGLIFMNICRAETYVRPRREMKMKKSWLWCFSLRGGLSPAFSRQPCVKCFSLSSIQSLPMPDVTSHPPPISLLICTHLSQGTSQTHTPSQAGTQIG